MCAHFALHPPSDFAFRTPRRSNLYALILTPIHFRPLPCSYTTLVNALTITSLLPVFQNPPYTYTLFAPSNSAFAKIPFPLWDWLTNPRKVNNDALANVLKYHALSTVVFSTAIAPPPNGTRLNTLCPSCTPVLSAFNEGTQVTIRQTSTSSVLATVTTADINCTNGVVHDISDVLTPGGVGLPTQNVVQKAASAGLSQLSQALATTGLNVTLSTGNGVYTVFAPTNAAFAALPSYIANNATLLKQVLLYHVIVNRTYAANLPLGVNATVATLNSPQTLKVLRSSAGIVTVFGVSGTANVTTADVDSTNAVVHVIDRVLLPAGLPQPPASLSPSPAPSSTPGVLVPTPPASTPTGELQVRFTIDFLVDSSSDFQNVATTNTAVGSAIRNGLFKACMEAAGTNATSAYDGLIILNVNGVAPNPNINTRNVGGAQRRLQAAVPLLAALLVKPNADGSANSALANTIATKVTTVVLAVGSSVLRANMAGAVDALVNAGVVAYTIDGAGGSAAVVNPTAPGTTPSSTGAIVGGVVGGIAVLGALAGAALYWRRRHFGAANDYEVRKTNLAMDFLTPPPLPSLLSLLPFSSLPLSTPFPLPHPHHCSFLQTLALKSDNPYSAAAIKDYK